MPPSVVVVEAMVIVVVVPSTSCRLDDDNNVGVASLAHMRYIPLKCAYIKGNHTFQ